MEDMRKEYDFNNISRVPQDPQLIIESLQTLSKERKLWRRRACQFIRDNQRNVPSRIWTSSLARKISRGYLGDYSDIKLMEVIKEIVTELERRYGQHGT